DLRRFPSEEPVVARPPSNLYRFQKMVRRNKVAFGAAAAVAGALILGLGLSTWLFLRERTAHQQALAAERKAAASGTQLAEALNELQLQKAEELFASGDSSTALAYLARVLRQNLTNEVVGARL